MNMFPHRTKIDFDALIECLDLTPYFKGINMISISSCIDFSTQVPITSRNSPSNKRETIRPMYGHLSDSKHGCGMLEMPTLYSKLKAPHLERVLPW